VLGPLLPASAAERQTLRADLSAGGVKLPDLSDQGPGIKLPDLSD
jgi:hypothetical protein